MKKLKNLNGAKELSKNEQKSIKGGLPSCWKVDTGYVPCPDGFICIRKTCYPYIGPDL